MQLYGSLLQEKDPPNKRESMSSTSSIQLENSNIAPLIDEQFVLSDAYMMI